MAILTTTQTQWLKKVTKNPQRFKDVPSELQTDLFLQEVLKGYPFLIGEVKNPSFELQLFAAQQPVYAYDDSALATLKTDSDYLKFQTIKHSPTLFNHLKDTTPRVRLEAIKQEPNYFAFCDCEFQNEEEVIVALSRDERLWEEVNFGLFKNALIESALITLLWSGEVVEFRDETTMNLIRQLVDIRKKNGRVGFNIQIQEPIERIEENPLDLSCLENQFKTYRLSRYAVRLNKLNRWFSPYQVLEAYEDYLLTPTPKRIV